MTLLGWRPSPVRRRLLERVAGLVPAPADRPVRVAVDGVDGAGKTVFADELASTLRQHGRPVVRASVDGFHHPPEVRHRRGRYSPEGFWLDSYDYDRFVAELLVPFGPHCDRWFRPAVYDVRAERALDLPARAAPPAAVLVVDGIFLHRGELVSYWDFSVFLEVGFDVSVARVAERDGTSPDPAGAGTRRYVQGQRLYLRACDPRARAGVVVDNTDLDAPRILDRR